MSTNKETSPDGQEPPGVSHTLGYIAGRSTRRFWGRLLAFASVGGAIVAAVTHTPRAIPIIAVAFILSRVFLFRSKSGGGLPQMPSLPMRKPIDPTRANIGMGASIGRGAQVMPGAVVEMGADVGEDAIIESGAVVRMGASVGAGAVIETGAIVSWGADVKKGARVCADARIGAGATVGAGAIVPAKTWVMPGGDWHGGLAPEERRLKREEEMKRLITSSSSNSSSNSNSSRNPSSSPAAESRSPAPSAAPAAPPIDPRQAKLDLVFARIDAEIAKSPPLVREHLAASAKGVKGLRDTCTNLLEREQSLRAESSADSIDRLDSEKNSLAARIAATTDEPVRISLASAVAAIEEQKRQRLLLARSADRLDAELTRLFWTLDGLAAQLLRMRSAGADAAQVPDAELTRSVQALQGEIDAIADALEQVSKSERTAESSSSPAEKSAAMREEFAAAPPDAAAGDSAASSKSERERS